jgi:hypothetical protein
MGLHPDYSDVQRFEAVMPLQFNVTMIVDVCMNTE